MLTTGYWPAYPPAPLKLPRELLEHLEAFEKFYLSKHQGRRLTWQAHPRPRHPPRAAATSNPLSQGECYCQLVPPPSWRPRPEPRCGPAPCYGAFLGAVVTRRRGNDAMVRCDGDAMPW